MGVVLFDTVFPGGFVDTVVEIFLEILLFLVTRLDGGLSFVGVSSKTIGSLEDSSGNVANLASLMALFLTRVASKELGLPPNIMGSVERTFLFFFYFYFFLLGVSS
eukprot:scaffold193410_cov45-Attheya_sp.AAC.1